MVAPRLANRPPAAPARAQCPPLHDRPLGARAEPPETHPCSTRFDARLAEQFDAVLYLDRTGPGDAAVFVGRRLLGSAGSARAGEPRMYAAACAESSEGNADGDVGTPGLRADRWASTLMR